MSADLVMDLFYIWNGFMAGGMVGIMAMLVAIASIGCVLVYLNGRPLAQALVEFRREIDEFTEWYCRLPKEVQAWLDRQVCYMRSCAPSVHRSHWLRRSWHKRNG